MSDDHFLPCCHTKWWGNPELGRKSKVKIFCKSTKAEHVLTPVDNLFRKKGLYGPKEKTLAAPIDNAFGSFLLNSSIDSKIIKHFKDDILKYLIFMAIRHPINKKWLEDGAKRTFKIMTIARQRNAIGTNRRNDWIKNEFAKNNIFLTQDNINEFRHYDNEIKRINKINYCKFGKLYSGLIVYDELINYSKSNQFSYINFLDSNTYINHNIYGSLNNMNITIFNTKRRLPLGERPLLCLCHKNNNFYNARLDIEKNNNFCYHIYMPLKPTILLQLTPNCNMFPGEIFLHCRIKQLNNKIII